MLNSIINVDLHIHSKASDYKEQIGFVDESSVENLDVLFNKLQENNINLFSITDHNRFDVNIYSKAKDMIESGKYPVVKEILAGVEFDVILEENMKPCHIITIFDAKDCNDRARISHCINKKLLKSKDESYSRIQFENLLKEIGLNSILIVHQKQSLDKIDKSHKSLSGSIVDPYRIIEIGYISALEYQKSAVEGILKDNLKKIDQDVALFTGSDCHQWNFYPKHDRSSDCIIQKFTNMKCLPSFKGLLLSITSPNTRINQIEKVFKNTNISNFSIGEHNFRVDCGINAIVGENGSGKSTLMELLNGNVKPPHIKRISKESEFDCKPTLSKEKTLVVGQSEIVDKFNSNNLFDSSLYKEIDHREFDEVYNQFSKELKRKLESNIEFNESYESLKELKIQINPENEIETFFYQVATDNLKLLDLEKIEERINSLKLILKNIDKEIQTGFYNDDQLNVLQKSYESLLGLYKDLLSKYFNDNNRNIVKNLIIKCCQSYKTEIANKSTALDSLVTNYNEKKRKIIDSVVSHIKDSNKSINITTNVDILFNKSENQNNGFIFRRIAKYDNQDILEMFLKKMFISEYQDFDKLKSIKTKIDLQKAITGCVKISDIDKKWSENLNKFLSEYKECNEYILEANTNEIQGGTLGEISLTYYKYHLNTENNVDVVCIDQPEDHISNNRINKELIKYLNALRKDKQIFIVTHNPLLIINLDVDNVIQVELRNNKIACVSGCLEDEESGILTYIAEKMDGGKESIGKRYKLYE